MPNYRVELQVNVTMDVNCKNAEDAKKAARNITKVNLLKNFKDGHLVDIWARNVLDVSVEPEEQ